MNIVCQDVQKAFDKIWTQGLKYKIIKIPDLPDIIQKILCSFILNRTAQIRIENFKGDKINLESGVPQGGILSPTLYILYTRDTPPPAGENNNDIIFTDDVTQVIQNLRDDRRALAELTELEIERINNYEKKWKIQTSINKFSLISISKKSPEPFIVNNRQIPFKDEVKMLVLTLKRTGATSHTTHRIKLANVQSKRIKRFIKLDPKVKLHLYKALIRPLMEYPIIANGIQAKAHLKKCKESKNKNLKLIAAYCNCDAPNEADRFPRSVDGSFKASERFPTPETSPLKPPKPPRTEVRQYSWCNSTKKEVCMCIRILKPLKTKKEEENHRKDGEFAAPRPNHEKL